MSRMVGITEMSIEIIPPYVPPYAPIPTVQPFTYRDGVTYWEKLNGIIRFVNRTIIPYVNDHIAELGEEFQSEINTLITQVNDAIQLVVDNSIELQDPVMAGILNDVDSQTRQILDTLVPGDPEFAALVADSNSDTYAAIGAKFAKITDIPKLAFNRKKKAVFFGDSWLTIYDKTVVNTVSAFLNLDSTSYAISNSAFNSGPVTIESQVITAAADATVDPKLVEYVIVVCGTNNIFWGRDFTFGGIGTFWDSVRQLYPNAEIFFIPENANDYNSGRTYQYNTMMLGSQYRGIKVADWAIWLMWYNFGAFYAGTDDNGRQHLTSNGYGQFAAWIASWIKGTDLSSLGMKIKFAPVFDDTATSVTFTAGNSMANSFNDRSFIKNGVVTMDLEFINLTYKSGESSPRMRLLGTKEPWSPINNNAGGSNTLGAGFAGSYGINTNIVPDINSGYKLFTQWVGSGVFTSARMRTQYSLLGALP